MRIHRIRLPLIVAAGLLLIVATTQGDPPTAITYQGRLTDDTDTPIDGIHDFIFSLCPDATGTTELTTIAVDNVTVENGYFTVLLDFGASAFSGGVAWYLETQVRPDGRDLYETLGPRRQLVSVPYAQYAVTVKDGSIGANKLAGGAVTGAKIDDGTITFADLGQNGADPGQVMKWNGSAWNAANDESGGGTGTSDHGSLTGLGDDDHPQYLRSDTSDVFNDSGSGASLRFEGSGDPNLMYLSGTLDRIGIGTANPDGKLQVLGGRVAIGDPGSASLAYSAGDLYVESNLEVGRNSRIDDDLEIGDGSTDYDGGSETLKISAQSANWYFGVRNEAGAGDADVFLGVDANDEDTFCIERDGSVGIGTAGPGGRRLHVLHSGSAMASAAGYFENTHGSGVALVADTDSSNPSMILWQEGGGDFLRCSTSVLDSPICLKSNGTVECKVLEITGGSDLAEPFPTASGEAYPPGTVLAIDENTPGALRMAEAAYDRRVAGVVSGAGGINTGVMLRQTGTAADGECPVALSGRTYVLADADFGPITPGDLLTTSATPGYAMKVSDYDRAQGAVLGKAMSSLERGRGLVLILVSMH